MENRFEQRRLELHAILTNILESKNVYYQPPETIRMSYPSIVYKRDNIQNDFANNGVYSQHYVYEVTVIDEDPDSEIVDKVSKISTSNFERHFTVDNLNHDVFTIYY